MTGFTDTESCTSCGVSSNVKKVEVKYGGQWVPQAWCEPCRRAKLVRRREGKAPGWKRGAVRAGLLILAMAIMVALVMAALRLGA